MKKPRVMVAKLWSGYYLKPNGERTNDLAQAARFTELDAAKFLKRVGPIGYDDPLHGLSWEMLAKRTAATYISDEDQHALIARMRINRVLAEAERQDRLAVEYKAQAKAAEERAYAARVKAAELRMSIQYDSTLR